MNRRLAPHHKAACHREVVKRHSQPRLRQAHEFALRSRICSLLWPGPQHTQQVAPGEESGRDDPSHDQQGPQDLLQAEALPQQNGGQRQLPCQKCLLRSQEHRRTPPLLACPR